MVAEMYKLRSDFAGWYASAFCVSKLEAYQPANTELGKSEGSNTPRNLAHIH